MKVESIHSPEVIYIKEGELLVSIETTGLNKKTDIIYAITLLSKKSDGNIETVQLFAELLDRELEIVEEFLNRSLNYNTLIFFNGERFDIPFILNRARGLNTESLRKKNIVSVIDNIKNYDFILSLKNYKRTTIEEFLKIKYDNILKPKKAIAIYRDYIINSEKSSEDILLSSALEKTLHLHELLEIRDYIIKRSTIEIKNSTFKIEEINIKGSYILVNGTYKGDSDSILNYPNFSLWTDYDKGKFSIEVELMRGILEEGKPCTFVNLNTFRELNSIEKVVDSPKNILIFSVAKEFVYPHIYEFLYLLLKRELS